MEKFSKTVNIIAFVISAISVTVTIVAILLFSSTYKVNVQETNLYLKNEVVTKRTTNNNSTYYFRKDTNDITYCVLVAFELFDMENEPIFLIAEDENEEVFITINEEEVATVSYNNINT